jgi:hypothetical protein
MTALEQAIFLADRGGVIRRRTVVAPPEPRGPGLAEMVRTHCAEGPAA